jgi:hypothetical protein
MRDHLMLAQKAQEAEEADGPQPVASASVDNASPSI